MTQRFVVEVEPVGNDVTAEDLRLSLPLIVPWLKVKSVSACSVQELVDDVHALRDRIESV